MSILFETLTSKPQKAHVQISGRTSGGANYLCRVLSEYKKTPRKTMIVGVSPGAQQENVANRIQRDYDLFNETVNNTLPFSLRVIAQYGEY